LVNDIQRLPNELIIKIANELDLKSLVRFAFTRRAYYYEFLKNVKNIEHYFRARLQSHPNEINDYLACKDEAFLSNIRQALQNLSNTDFRNQLPIHLSQDNLLLKQIGNQW